MLRRSSLGTRVLVALLALVLVGLVALTAHPGPARVRAHENSADIRFQADRRWVVREGDCVTVRWALEGIQAVYLNGQGRIGHDEQRFCVNAPSRRFELVVHFPDGTQRTYTLEVGQMLYAPEVWLLVAAALTLGFALAFRVVGPLVARRRWFVRLRPVLRSVARWGALLAVSGVAALLALEVGLRAYFTAYGTEAQRVRYLYSDEEISARSRLRALPFLNVGLSPLGSNRLGYRGAEVAVPKPSGVFRIVIVGDSTVYGLGVRTDETLSAQLERVLRDEYGYERVEVVNAGVSGYNSWNSVVNLAFRVPELEPDLIIAYHTITDIGARLTSPQCYRGLNRHRGLYPQAAVWQVYGQVSTASTLARFVGITLGWMDAPDPEKNLAHVIPCADDPAPEPAEALAANPPIYFERNLRSLAALARAQGAAIMFSTFAHDRDISGYWGEAWMLQAMEEHNAIVRQVAEQTDALFYDLAAQGPLTADPRYWGSDGIHPSPEGYRWIAEHYAAYLVAEGALRPEGVAGESAP